MFLQKFEKNTQGKDWVENRYNHPSFATGVKSEYETNEGDIAIVVEYKYYEHVVVTFKDKNTPQGFTLVCQLGDLRRGRVKNPYKRQIYGVGFKGVGIHLTAYKGKNTKCYKTWAGMLERCYSENQDRPLPSYNMCVVEDYWHNFQNFASWFYCNYKDGWDLDKDLFSERGKKVYSETTCTFLPRKLNSMLSLRNTDPVKAQLKLERIKAEVLKFRNELSSIVFDTLMQKQYEDILID